MCKGKDEEVEGRIEVEDEERADEEEDEEVGVVVTIPFNSEIDGIKAFDTVETTVLSI